MITAIRLMHPLPVPPVDRDVRMVVSPTPVRSTDIMRPLPHLTEREDLGCAVKDAAFQRMLDRMGIKEPLPIDDPTA